MATWTDYLTQTPVRNKIMAVGLTECLKAPRISDIVLDQDGKRLGWTRLKNYFDVTINGWNQDKWKDSSILAGVQIPCKRVPGVLHWCGIFTTYCLMQAGVAAKWHCGFSPSIRGAGVKYVSGRNREIKPGDICVSALPSDDGGTIHHHYLVMKINGDTMETIDGNSRYQDITYNTRPLKQPYGHFSIVE